MSNRRSMAAEAFPIRTVCALTGLNPITLRAWERRYGLIKPIRTPGGHRLYTQEHVDQINRALSMLERGMPIGSAARALRASSAGSANVDIWSAMCAQTIAAIVRFDEDALDAIYESALALQPIAAVTRKLLLPVLGELGRRWESAEGRVAEEHFFTTYTRNKLGARLHHRRRVPAAFKLLCACGPGEHHELGLLLFALTAHDHGVACILLGADMPVVELAAACARANCDGIVISVAVEPRTPWLEQELPRLLALTAKPVFVGGRACSTHARIIGRSGAIAIGADIARGLRRIVATLTGPSQRG